MPSESELLKLVKQCCYASEADAERLVYSIDASCIKGNTAAVAWPADAAELQKLVRLAAREKLVLVLRGGGTGLVGGAVPQNAVIVDLSRLNHIKLNLKEKTALVESGVVLDELNNAIGQFGLEFPVRPGSHAACSIGGMIATNAAGMLAGKFGRTADWLLSIKLMDGTGKLFDFQGHEARQFAGTEGCCGIIVEAKLKLSELSNRISSDLFVFDNVNALLRKAEELKQNPDVVSLEYVNKIAAQLAGLKPAEHLLVKYSNLVGKLAVDDAASLWKLRENLYSVLVEAGYSRIEDPEIPVEQLGMFLSWLESKGLPCYGHLSLGILHPHLRKDQSIEEMFELVKNLGGKPASEHGIGLLKKKYASFAFVQKIKQLKASYDPYNILNKGKIS